MSHAKVRVLADPNGKTVKAAYPGMAVTVSGWKELPKAGDEVLQGTESEVKKALANRTRKAEMEATLGDMDALNQQRRNERELREKEADAAAADEELEETSDKSEPDIKELKLVIKADVSGTVEAVAGALQGIGNNLARVRIVATGVGDVTESDVMRAKAIGGGSEISLNPITISEDRFFRNGCWILCGHTSSRSDNCRISTGHPAELVYYLPFDG